MADQVNVVPNQSDQSADANAKDGSPNVRRALTYLG